MNHQSDTTGALIVFLRKTERFRQQLSLIGTVPNPVKTDNQNQKKPPPQISEVGTLTPLTHILSESLRKM